MNKTKGSILILIIAGAGLLAYRHFAQSSKAASAGAEHLPTVAVATVERRDLYRELRIQAEFRPYFEVELHAKVAGYLKTINVDFGDRVKAGDVIAEIEVPELRNQLDQAIAAEQRSEADYQNAHLDYGRLSGVNRTQPNLVAQQDLDAAEARDHGAAAAVAGAKADEERYRTLLGYTRIAAPFDGVVTARYADPGAMIQTASSSQTQSLPIVQSWPTCELARKAQRSPTEPDNIRESRHRKPRSLYETTGIAFTRAGVRLDLLVPATPSSAP